MQEARIKTSACHFVFALAWSLQVQPGVFENSMATLTWKKQKGWRIQDVDGGMTWFRHDDLGAADPPHEGWRVFREGHAYAESDLKVWLEEAWSCFSFFSVFPKLSNHSKLSKLNSCTCDRLGSRHRSSRQKTRASWRRRRRRTTDGMMMHARICLGFTCGVL